MAGAWTTLSIKDGGGTSRTMRVWDESGAGSGPFSFGQMLVDGTGSAAYALGTGATGATTQRMVLASDSPGVIAPGQLTSAQSVSVVGASDWTDKIGGDVAAAASDSGNPVKIGGVGKTANPTAVTDGQRVNALFDKLGKQVVVGAVRDLKGNQKATLSNTTSETTIVTAVASTFLDLYGLFLANSGASATKVDIRDTTGGTIRATIEVPAGDTRGFTLPVDSAMAQTAVNTNWTAQCSAATTALEVTSLFVKNL